VAQGVRGAKVTRWWRSGGGESFRFQVSRFRLVEATTARWSAREGEWETTRSVGGGAFPTQSVRTRTCRTLTPALSQRAREIRGGRSPRYECEMIGGRSPRYQDWDKRCGKVCCAALHTPYEKGCQRMPRPVPSPLKRRRRFFWWRLRPVIVSWRRRLGSRSGEGESGSSMRAGQPSS
jgi:hypothetical protein